MLRMEKKKTCKSKCNDVLVEALKCRLMRGDAVVLLASLVPCKGGDCLSRPPLGHKAGAWILRMGKNVQSKYNDVNVEALKCRLMMGDDAVLLAPLSYLLVSCKGGGRLSHAQVLPMIRRRRGSTSARMKLSQLAAVILKKSTYKR